MKKVILLTAGIGLLALSGVASAAEENGYYFGGGLSWLSLDFSDSTLSSAGQLVPESSVGLDFDRAPLLSLAAGYNWGPLALEMAYEYSLDSSDMSIQSANVMVSTA